MIHQYLRGFFMRLVATSDTHFPVHMYKMPIPDGDVFIHAGDLMFHGTHDEWIKNLKWLSDLPHKYKFFVPGNHDFHLQLYPGPALQDLRRIGFTVLGLPGNIQYEQVVLPNGLKMLGLPYVTNLPRWAFNSTEEDIHDYLMKKEGCDIVVSHCPPKSLLDGSDLSHFGIQAYTDFIDRTNPLLWICGHVHEQHGHMHYQKTHIYNVAMCDKNYQHRNPPLVLDL